MNIVRLRTDYMENPIGFDLINPSLGWTVEAEGQNKRQSAYRIVVARDAQFDAICFDSGVVDSDACVDVHLDEMTLAPRTRYFWHVRVWDESGAPSAFSEPAFFETGRYQQPWRARWVGAREGVLPQLRKGFSLSSGIRRARAYVCGVGTYCLFLNGQRVGEDVLAPFINAYDKWLQYETYDVTALLREGENALGAYLGNGYYAGRVNWPGIDTRRGLYGTQLGLLCEVIVEYEDGREVLIGTDESWKCAPSPFLRSEIYDGEVYDARLAQQGFDDAGFDDGAWENVRVIEPPKGHLEARRSVPLKVIETRPCERVILTPAGETVLDFGQNLSGWVRFHTGAPAGAEIVLQAGEVLDKQGNFYRDNMRTALAELRYICRGGGETYAPFMTFMGFRYIRLTGLLAPVDPADFTAEIVHSQLDRTGFFECSDARVNRLFMNALWGQRGNFVDVPTDCPQRDERMGWTGDAQVFCPTACMNMESDAFYRKYLYDLALEQKQHGYVPVVIPFFINGSGLWDFTTTAWGDAATIIPWDLYLYYGDKAVLAAQYDSMKAWVEYMRSADTDHVDRYGGFHLGDWLAQDTSDPFSLFGATPTDLIATAYYAYSTRILAKTARVMQNDADAAQYEALYCRIRKAFRREFMTPNGRVVSETQTAQVVALFMDLCDPDEKPVVAAHLKARIQSDNLLLTTGFVGTPYLCPALSENGLNEYAYQLLLSTGRPSWLYAVEHGATTIWERWNGIDEHGDFGPVSMNSFNHYAYGAIAEWLYRYVSGINPVENAPGFKRALLRPMPNSVLTYAKASVRTQYGLLACGWQLDGDRLTVEVAIPFGTEAEIVLPDADGCAICENDLPAQLAPSFTRGSGHWRYTYRHNAKTIDRRPTKEPTPRF
ncbi:MAG: family 78 glycoside hydrolase catalytic domain [Clostridia bacterium]